MPRPRPVQLLHHGLLLLDGHHREGQDVQQAGAPDSEGRGYQVTDQQMCRLHEEASYSDVAFRLSATEIPGLS